MEPSIYLIGALIFLFFSYKFTLIENAFLSLSSPRLQRMEDLEYKNLQLIKVLSKDNRLYSTTLIGDYISNSFCAIFFAVFFYEFLSYWGLLLGAIIAIFLIILVGETYPRAMGTQNYEKVTVKNAKFMKFFMTVYRPISFLIQFFSSLFINISGGDHNYREPLITEDDLKDTISLGMEEGIIDKKESYMIENVMDFRESYAKDIMTPRTDIIAVELDSTYDEIIALVSEENYSRMPVYDDTIDDIVGILNVKDLFHMDTTKPLRENPDIIKKPFFTFEYKPTYILFNEMQAKKLTVAIVSDEYGGTEGLITMEDLIERIVGSISDEYDDEDDEDIIKQDKNEYLVDGSMNLDDLNQILHLDLKSEEFDSVAGLMIEKLDYIPKEGEEVTIDNIILRVEKSSKKRIEKILVRLPMSK